MGGRESDLVLLDENGIRCDGRKVNETRKVTISHPVLIVRNDCVVAH